MSAQVCSGCGVAIPTTMLACYACGKLVHTDALKRLASEAEAAQAAGETATALERWRAALVLLPVASRQHGEVQKRLTALSNQVAAAPLTTSVPTAQAAPAWAKRLGPFGAVALFLWKFKFLALALLSKGKFLLLGLTKATTFFSMLLSFAAYWALFGWKFGLGLVVSIYVHEMGHVAALRRFGIPATAPMFIPGLGAMVRLNAHPATAAEDAAVGLAGPLAGLGAALGCLVVWQLGGGGPSTWGALVHTGAWLNLFNLLPVWQLDGSRGFAALSRPQRWIVTAAFVVAWAVTTDGLLALIAVVAATRCLGKEAPPTGDRRTLYTFLFLIAVLGALVAIPMPRAR